MKLKFLIGVFICFGITQAGSLDCDRRPQGATGSPAMIDGDFQILIEGNPSSYIPGQRYYVTLSCAVNFKFSSFTLVAETETGAVQTEDEMTGHFEIIDPAETRFKTQCENIVENTNWNQKNRIDVAWIAPTNPNSTCIYLKAAALQHRDVWYMDAEPLTKRICPEEIDDINIQTPVMHPCCACDEAKYEIVLRRRWMRNTHPKDFPEEDRRTRFSEIIGTSHEYDASFWKYGSLASPGLKELAEYGATQTLENEIKTDIPLGKIRTIIKAPGVPFQKNIMGTTLATARVDPVHHMISLVTKIIPSPDWILGISGLELCLANCTWIQEKVLNLFPWDIGTDSGATYESPDQQQVPPDVVRRLPFYDESGDPMKPMATVYITRKKIYDLPCEEDKDVELECATHPWMNWTECSTKCGQGTHTRQRFYKNPSLAARFNCEVRLHETDYCTGECADLFDEENSGSEQTAQCALRPWEPWGPCSASCGSGFQKRARNFENRYARVNCLAGNPDIELEQTRPCSGNECTGDNDSDNDNNRFNNYARKPDLEEDDSYTKRPYTPTQRWPATGNRNDEINQYWTTSDQSKFGDSDQNGYDPRNINRQQPRYGQPKFDDSDQTGYDPRNINRQQQQVGQPKFGDIDQNAYDARNMNRHQPASNEDERTNNYPSNSYPSYNYEDNSYGKNLQNSNNYRYPNRYNQNNNNEASTNNYENNNLRNNVATENRQLNQENEIKQFCYYKPGPLNRCPDKNLRKLSNFWLYDSEDRQCKLFTTNLCDTSENKFSSMEKCEEVCQIPISNQEKEIQVEQEGVYNRPNQFEQRPWQVKRAKLYSKRN